MQLDHIAAARPLMQTVDILRDDRDSLVDLPRLELREREVSRIGQRRGYLWTPRGEQPPTAIGSRWIVSASSSARSFGFIVHSPPGPRYGGKPLATEIPAPVSTTMRR